MRISSSANKMKNYDIVIIGHVSHDILNYRGEVSRFIGGAAYFSSFAAKKSGAELLVVTKMAEDDFGLLNGMRKEGIEVLAIPSQQTTSIENIFVTDDVDNRKVNLLSQADPFSMEDIPEVKARVYNLAGLFKGEFQPSMIKTLSRRGKVALDLQAMLRTSKRPPAKQVAFPKPFRSLEDKAKRYNQRQSQWLRNGSEHGKFAWNDWDEKDEYLPHLTYLKADSLESKVITGTEDRRKAAQIMNSLGAEEVMITHSSEVIVYDGKKYYSAPFKPGNLSGRAGRGDTCFISYMTRKLSHDTDESLKYAAALTSIKMERPGPFSGTQDDVLARMKTF